MVTHHHMNPPMEETEEKASAEGAEEEDKIGVEMAAQTAVAVITARARRTALAVVEGKKARLVCKTSQ